MADGDTDALGPTVLMVDDDPLMRSTLRRILQKQRVNIAWAKDGIEAMELLHAGLEPRLILLDLEMPRMNGWQVLEKITLDPKLAQIPVVIVSGSLPDSDLPTARFLSKPFRVSELLELLREHCGLR